MLAAANLSHQFTSARRGVTRDIATDVRKLAPSHLKVLVHTGGPRIIRQLRNVLERAVLLGESDVVEANDLQFEDDMFFDAVDSTEFSLEKIEKRHIERVLEDEHGPVERAARRLGIPRSTMYKKIKKYALERT